MIFRISHNTGIRAVDIGLPMLGMHSIREMMGGNDLTLGYKLLRRFFSDFHDIDDAISTENIEQA